MINSIQNASLVANKDLTVLGAVGTQHLPTSKISNGERHIQCGVFLFFFCFLAEIGDVD